MQNKSEKVPDEVFAEDGESEIEEPECGVDSDALKVILENFQVQAAAYETEMKDLTAKSIRLQADFDNFRKRNAEQSRKAREDGIVETLTKIIPLLDVVSQALKMINDEKIAEGVRMIGAQIVSVLTGFGAVEIPALGKPFDPNFHNAVLQINVSNPDQVGIVVEVFQPGYMIGDRILRYSAVKVGC